MVKNKHNRLELLYQQRGQYLYGAVIAVKGTLDNQSTSNPFIISKSLGDKKILYGSVLEDMNRVDSILKRYSDRQKEALKYIENNNLPMPKSRRQGNHLLIDLPESEDFDSFLHERERDAEEAILLSAVHLRTLMELFSGKFGKRKIKLYDYHKKMSGEISLKDVFDLLLHHRYFVIKGEHIIDLFSHKRGLSLAPSFGYRISMFELMDAVLDLISEIRVNDFIGILRTRLKNLSAESEPQEIIFAVQNVHALKNVIEERMQDGKNSEFLNLLFEDETKKQIQASEREHIRKFGRSPNKIDLAIAFKTPNFKIGGDLSEQSIEVHCWINGKDERKRIKYKKFFGVISKIYGNDPLFIPRG